MGILESNAISTVKCNPCCFCIYLYVQIQRIRCKNIYIQLIYASQIASQKKEREIFKVHTQFITCFSVSPGHHPHSFLRTNHSHVFGIILLRRDLYHLLSINIILFSNCISLKCTQMVSNSIYHFVICFSHRTLFFIFYVIFASLVSFTLISMYILWY